MRGSEARPPLEHVRDSAGLRTADPPRFAIHSPRTPRVPLCKPPSTREQFPHGLPRIPSTLRHNPRGTRAARPCCSARTKLLGSTCERHAVFSSSRVALGDTWHHVRQNERTRSTNRPPPRAADAHADAARTARRGAWPRGRTVPRFAQVRLLTRLPSLSSSPRSLGAPERVLGRHLLDQCDALRTRRVRCTLRATARLPAPEQLEALPMPAQ